MKMYSENRVKNIDKLQVEIFVGKTKTNSGRCNNAS